MLGIIQTLQTLLELAGVNAALVFDAGGALLAHRGHAVYDRALLSQVSATVVKAIDSLQLRHESWDTVTAQFTDGKLLLRNLGEAPDGRALILAVVADANLNPSFATVAMRVAVAKLKKAIEAGGAAGAVAEDEAPATPRLQPGPSGAAPSPASHAPAGPGDSRLGASGPVIANSGLSWSGIGGSGTGSSGVTVADQNASHYVTRVSKELARFVGPMSKVYVKEAIRRVSPGAPFSLAQAAQLVAELAVHIDDPGDRQRFARAIEQP